MPDPQEDPKARYLQRAKTALRTAKLDDFLKFLTVRRFAGGSATARFYDAFPVPRGGDTGGRAELLELLKKDAAPTDILSGAPVTAETTLRLMRLVNDLKDRKPEAVDELKAVAMQDFDGYFNTEDNAAIDVLNLLMVAAARSDPDARERLVAAYDALMDNYSGLESALLTAIGREPIPALGSMRNFAAIITALYDGLAIRARMGESENAKALLQAALLPIVAALTVPIGSEAPPETEMLFGNAAR
jgi:hypothetical protein